MIFKYLHIFLKIDILSSAIIFVIALPCFRENRTLLFHDKICHQVYVGMRKLPT